MINFLIEKVGDYLWEQIVFVLEKDAVFVQTVVKILVEELVQEDVLSVIQAVKTLAVEPAAEDVEDVILLVRERVVEVVKILVLTHVLENAMYNVLAQNKMR